MEVKVVRGVRMQVRDERLRILVECSSGLVVHAGAEAVTYNVII